MYSKIVRFIKLTHQHYHKHVVMSSSRYYATTSSTGSPTDADYVEQIVCKDADLGENGMKTFDVGEHGKVLVVRQNGKLSALGHKCTHYGAPLEKAALGSNRIRCQWHGACFNATTGDIEDYPGLDSLPCYKVWVDEAHNVLVRAPVAELANTRRIKQMLCSAPDSRSATHQRHIVVLGGGPSSLTCVEVLRQNGFDGQLTLVCGEPYLPYDRIKLSKSMNSTAESLQLRSAQFLKDIDVDVRLGTKAINLDTAEKSVSLSNGERIGYTQLYIATGMRARTIPQMEPKLNGVYVIRTIDDAHAVDAQLRGTTGEQRTLQVVVLGASFIGMEAAAYCSDKAASVLVVGRGKTPFPQMGERIGHAFRTLYESKNVKFRMESGLRRCIADAEGQNIEAAELVDGEVVPCDILIVGVGAVPNSEFIGESAADIELEPDGSIDVDEYLRTGAEDVFAGGDIAHAPVWPDQYKATIGHYGLAQQHGRMAALNMIRLHAASGNPDEKGQPLQAVPFFWTMVFGKSLRWCGHGSYDSIEYVGDVEQLRFAAYYIRDDRIIAMSSCQMDPIVSKFGELLAQSKQLTVNDVQLEEHQKTMNTNPAWTNMLYS